MLSPSNHSQDLLHLSSHRLPLLRNRLSRRRRIWEPRGLGLVHRAKDVLYELARGRRSSYHPQIETNKGAHSSQTTHSPSHPHPHPHSSYPPSLALPTRRGAFNLSCSVAKVRQRLEDTYCRVGRMRRGWIG